MIMRGGRTQLAKLLKGSREKSILAHGLDECPSYGYYRDLPYEEVLKRVDWVILEGYLEIEYSKDLPMLVFSESGWAIELETMAEELLHDFDTLLTTGPPYDFTHLKDRDRQMIFRLLDKVEASARPELIPLLQAWEAVDYAKVRARIGRVVRALGGGPAR